MSPDKQGQGISLVHRRAKDELALKAAPLVLPWLLFALVTAAGFALRVAFGHWLWLTAPLVLVTGLALAGLDLHLRRHHSTVVGRWIGPVTTAAAAVMTAAYLLAGTSVPLALLWLFGGIGACTGWDLWMTVGSRHDFTRALSAASEAAGLGTARVTPARAPREPRTAPARTRSRPVQRGTVSFDAATPAQAVEQVTQIEAENHWPPGALGLSPTDSDAAEANYSVSDPQVLAESEPWPGPSAPGASMSVPFRLGRRQDNAPFTYRAVPVHHRRISGKTGSGKTMSAMYGFHGEAVTRLAFAGYVIDIFKQQQFAGPMAPALHGLDVTVEQALARFLAFQRARRARQDYLTRTGQTEWTDDCGLSFLSAWMEEAPVTLHAIAELSKGKAGNAAFTVEDWCEAIKGDRSSGTSWTASMQLGQATEMPTKSRGQMGAVCFGTDNRKESLIGLSDQQLQNGCRPELWRGRYPGKAYVDVDTMDAADTVMPVRFYDWGRDASTAAAYFGQWLSEDRPLDEVTAEAMAAEPPLPDSYYPTAARPDPRTAARNVTVGPWGQPQRKGPTAHERADAAEAVVRAQLAAWLKSGKTVFTPRELELAGVHKQTHHSRPWIYTAIASMCDQGFAEEVATKGRKRWRILPACALPESDEA